LFREQYELPWIGVGTYLWSIIYQAGKACIWHKLIILKSNIMAIGPNLKAFPREKIAEILDNMEPSYENLCAIMEYDPILFALFVKEPSLDPIKKKQWEEVLNDLRTSVQKAIRNPKP